MLDPLTDTAFCAYKRGPGYGRCGVARERPTLEQAARSLVAKVYGDYDGRRVCFSLTDALGVRQREWDDFTAALELL